MKVSELIAKLQECPESAKASEVKVMTDTDINGCYDIEDVIYICNSEHAAVLISTEFTLGG